MPGTECIVLPQIQFNHSVVGLGGTGYSGFPPSADKLPGAIDMEPLRASPLDDTQPKYPYKLINS